MLICLPQCQLAEARDVKFNQTLTEPLRIGSHILCTGTPTEDLPWYARESRDIRKLHAQSPV